MEEWRSGGESGIMGCFHSKSVSPRKKTGPDTQPRGTPTPEAEPEVHPEIVQLAEVSSDLCMTKVSIFQKKKHAANALIHIAHFISLSINSV